MTTLSLLWIIDEVHILGFSVYICAVCISVIYTLMRILHRNKQVSRGWCDQLSFILLDISALNKARGEDLLAQLQQPYIYLNIPVLYHIPKYLLYMLDISLQLPQLYVTQQWTAQTAVHICTLFLIKSIHLQPSILYILNIIFFYIFLFFSVL